MISEGASIAESNALALDRSKFAFSDSESTEAAAWCEARRQLIGLAMSRCRH